MQMPTPFEIIQRLGGRNEVAAILGISNTNAVTQWYKVGFPAKYHIDLLTYAAMRGIPLTRRELENARYSDRIEEEVRPKGYRHARRHTSSHLAMAS